MFILYLKKYFDHCVEMLGRSGLLALIADFSSPIKHSVYSGNINWKQSEGFYLSLVKNSMSYELETEYRYWEMTHFLCK